MDFPVLLSFVRDFAISNDSMCLFLLGPDDYDEALAFLLRLERNG
jgi:hypothetical protein